MGAHLIDGEFQSDKYPMTPRGKVPLSVKDKAAQPLLWQYADDHRPIDAEFSDDLQEALRLAGYEPKGPPEDDTVSLVIARRIVANKEGSIARQPSWRAIRQVARALLLLAGQPADDLVAAAEKAGA